MKKELFWEDINCTAVFEYSEELEVPHLQFKIFDIVATDANSKEKFYEKKGAKSSEDMTNDIKEAQTLLSGRIKWDACSHVNFGDEGYIHLCGVHSWRKLYKAINKVWEYARNKNFTEDDFKETL